MRRGNYVLERPMMGLVTFSISKVWDIRRIQTYHLNTQVSDGRLWILATTWSSIRNKWKNDGAKPKHRSHCIKPITYTRMRNKHMIKEPIYSLVLASQIWIPPNRVTALSTIPTQEVLAKKMTSGVQSIPLLQELPKPRMWRVPSVSITEWLITVPSKPHLLIWLCKASKGSKAARRHRDSTQSSQFTDLAPMACQTLQMTWIMFGNSKLRSTDLKTLCTAHSLKAMAGVTLNLAIELSKEEVTRILMNLKNKPWNWLEKTPSPSQRESASTRILRKSSKKWRTRTVTLNLLKPNWDNMIRLPRWVKNHLQKVSCQNSSHKVRSRWNRIWPIDCHRCQRAQNSKINWLIGLKKGMKVDLQHFLKDQKKWRTWTNLTNPKKELIVIRLVWPQKQLTDCLLLLLSF